MTVNLVPPGSDLGLYLGGHGDAQLILDLFGVFEDA